MESVFEKNQIARQVSQKNEVFVTRKKPIKVYIKRIEKLLDERTEWIYLHGSGMAVKTVVEIVVLMRKFFSDVKVKTSSVAVVDKVADEGCKVRMIPGIHVELTSKL